MVVQLNARFAFRIYRNPAIIDTLFFCEKRVKSFNQTIGIKNSGNVIKLAPSFTAALAIRNNCSLS